MPHSSSAAAPLHSSFSAAAAPLQSTHLHSRIHHDAPFHIHYYQGFLAEAKQAGSVARGFFTGRPVPS
ncbi:hypothetical protein PR202_gb00038 [Eleusine coracana subsp. coracana]|uniref:Uncharacterized protein n=1 Tax=Eleusine coracana subsp. coracana TaxID=191504 RepID=A0AAV5DTV9_ELECO|nr:hypothetical protein PR202_gb00038 [Eleusine coracana subsp. coracana]